ncbi:MAG: class I SAM-dependent methyltransferase [Pseudonocardiaceae bacterium]|nr:MAG: class I SAM-dependent methyltransferase [Pseudonocardiaceae bacterium]
MAGGVGSDLPGVVNMPTAMTRLLYQAFRLRLWQAMHDADPQGEQGVYVDPRDLPPLDTSDWGERQREAFESPEMAAFVAALRLDGKDVRDSVLDDLATYHRISSDEARDECLSWERASAEEWRATGASDSDEGRVGFYRSTRSWAFDLSWWAYLQAEGRADASNVMALRFAQQHATGRRHVDFGSGIGVTSQLFVRSGWSSTSADLSSTLLDFARFRHERHGDTVARIDLHEARLPAGAFDVITAIDTLAHVPDVYATCRQLHGALGPDGILIANFDIRTPTDETAWHLYVDGLQPLFDLRRAGFVPIGPAGYGLVGYRKVRASGMRYVLRSVWAWCLLVSPARRLARRVTRPVLRRLGAVARRRRG